MLMDGIQMKLKTNLAPLCLLMTLGVLGCSSDPGADDSDTESGAESGGETASTGATDDTSDEGESGSDAETDTGTGTTAGEAEGCDGVPLLQSDPDPSVAGPWPVGARTVQVDGFNVEIWYPAKIDPASDPIAKRYDIRTQLPDSEMGSIPDEANPWQDCDCFEDLELDGDHGPYPLVVFIHGTAGFRSQSLAQMTHWASRGFVVAAADYEGLRMAHILSVLCPDEGGTQNLSADTDKVFAAVEAASGDLAFLSGHVDTSRTGIAGHSAGGGAAAAGANKLGVQVAIPMASTSPTVDSTTLVSTLFLGGTSDGVVDYSGTQDAYDSNVTAKRLVGLDNAGHLAFSELCGLENEAGQDFVEIANEYGICGAAAAGFLFDCADTLLPEADAEIVVNYATTAVLEEVLHCKSDGPDLADIESVYTQVAEYRQAL